MAEKQTAYRDILEAEDALLSEVLKKQHELRTAVERKDWTRLTDVISSINYCMDQFNALDKERESLTNARDAEASADLLCAVRGKLLKCRTENKVINEYANTMRDFVHGILNEAHPQRRSRLYSWRGKIIQEQPKSVVINTLS